MARAQAAGSGVKIGVQISLALGLGVVIALIAVHGAGTIAGLLAGAGWKLALLAPLQTLPLLLDVMGWRSVILGRVRLPYLFLIACIRQAINRLLPVANIGGEIAGIRLLVQQGVDGAPAGASIVVELVLSLFAQYAFVAIGAVCLFSRTDNARAIQAVGIGLAAGLPPLILVIIIVRNGRVFHRVEQLTQRLLRPWRSGQGGVDLGARVDAAVREIFAAHGRLLRALAWQIAGLVAGCSETWFALKWLGHPVGFADALVLESLTQAAKSVFFMVPSALGVQEAGLIGVGLLLGLGSDVALALSLAKRVREVLLGLPSLLAWQFIEGRRIVLRVRRGNEP
jgi:putative membrane protein